MAWTKEDAATAKKDGWSLVDVWDLKQARLIYVILPREKQAVVIDRARHGSALHIRALQMCMTTQQRKTA